MSEITARIVTIIGETRTSTKSANDIASMIIQAIRKPTPEMIAVAEKTSFGAGYVFKRIWEAAWDTEAPK